MHVHINLAVPDEKPIIAAMLQGPYLRELATYFAPGESPAEHYDYLYLDDYWLEPGERFPFLITVDDDTAGFAFVNRYSRLGADDTWSMAELYIAPEHRRGGVGSTAAESVLVRFPAGGKWRF